MHGTFLRIIVLDGNPSWVRALFSAMPADVEVIFVRLISLGQGFRSTFGAWLDGPSLRRLAPTRWEQRIVIPGWSRAHGLSSTIVGYYMRSLIEDSPVPVHVVYNVPHYAGVAHRLTGIDQAYFAYDPYLFYDWEQQRIDRWERDMFILCDPVVAISRRLQEAFQERSGKNVLYCPNATSSTLIDALSRSCEIPADLPIGARPVIGCIGQINDTYDWDLLQALFDLCPELTFAFVGPVIEPDPRRCARIHAALAAPNVRYLGAKPPEALPSYLARFDVCLNPLRVTPQNHCRSQLRLYDYLCASKPILSTPLFEAGIHRPHVHLAGSPREMADLCRQASTDPQAFVLPDRFDYIKANTWEHRAMDYLAAISLRRESSAVEACGDERQSCLAF